MVHMTTIVATVLGNIKIELNTGQISLTIWDHYATKHCSKNNCQCQGFKSQRGHITSCSKCPIFLLFKKDKIVFI